MARHDGIGGIRRAIMAAEYSPRVVRSGRCALVVTKDAADALRGGRSSPEDADGREWFCGSVLTTDALAQFDIAYYTLPLEKIKTERDESWIF